MNPETLGWLRSPPGRAVLAELADRPLDERRLLPELTRLRAQHPPDLARAAIEQAQLRQRAAGKLRHAACLFFTREALEQASSSPVARHRAQRFVAAGYGHVVDVGCGIGGDALELASAGLHVTAIERDPTRALLAAANAAATGLNEHITVVQADVREHPDALHTALAASTPPAALFCDPARRRGGRRRFAVEDYEPPLSLVLRWLSEPPHAAAMGIKLAPGIDKDAVAQMAASTGQPYELEFLSLNGDLKEAVLWCGPLATPGVSHRASVLQRLPDTPHQATAHSLTSADPGPPPPLSPPAALLYEPDPAVIRAGLVAHLAARLPAAMLDSEIAYLTAEHATSTPFARAWTIHEWLPFQLKRLRARLRALDAGPVTVKKRGSPLDTNRLARQLSGNGSRPLVVVLTRVAGQPAALLADPRQES